MNDGLQQLFDILSKSGGTLCRDEPLSRWTSWQVGGPADLFYQPEGLKQLQVAVKSALTTGTPWLAIGAGSNLLVRDGGFRGLVIQTRKLEGRRFTEDGGLLVECGVWLPSLVRETVAAGWSGLECLAGIPGTLGGALVTNAGAHGRSLGDSLQQVELLNEGLLEQWSAEQVGCGYRSSRISPSQLVLSAELKLQKAAPEILQGRVKELLESRRQAQSVGGPNAGSVFKNPPAQAAWKLIDAAGMRGRSVGDAMVSTVHTNFIINCGAATAAQILQLMTLVKNQVKTCSGVTLETEVKVVGEA